MIDRTAETRREAPDTAAGAAALKAPPCPFSTTDRRTTTSLLPPEVSTADENDPRTRVRSRSTFEVFAEGTVFTIVNGLPERFTTVMEQFRNVREPPRS
jgi:hypothetical protein